MRYIRLVELALVLAILCDSTAFAQCGPDGIIGKWAWGLGVWEFKADHTQTFENPGVSAAKTIATWVQSGETYTITSGNHSMIVRLSADCQQLATIDNPGFIGYRLHPPATPTVANGTNKPIPTNTPITSPSPTSSFSSTQSGSSDQGPSSQQGLVNSQGEEIKLGDKIRLSPNDKIALGAKCKEFVLLLRGSMGEDRDLKHAILTLAYLRLKGQITEGSGSGDETELTAAFGQAVLDLVNCTYYCGKLYGENPELITQSASHSPLLSGSLRNQSDSPAQIELGLKSGPFLAEVVNNNASLSVKTNTATVTSSGKNTFGVAYVPSIDTTFVAAYQYPVNVQPTNSNLAPFTLEAGQLVDVSSEGVGPTMPIGQTGTNGTATGSGATGVPGTGNATTGNATNTGALGGISAPGGPIAPGASGTGTSTGGTLTPSGNNQIGDAANISTGQSVSQTINLAGSSNVYRFQTNSSGIVKLKLENVPKDMRPHLSLGDKNMGTISEKSASNPGDVLTLTKDVQGPGWFYISVNDADGKAHSEPYTLNVAFEPAPDRYEPNPNYFRATQIAQGQSITAYICPSGDDDFYKIFVNTSGIFKLKMDSVPADMRPNLELRDTGFSSIAYSSASSPGDKVKLEKDVRGPGWFYIRVNDADGKAHSEPYILNVAFEPAPDRYEPNSNYFRATQIAQGQSITAYICPSGDDDFYKIYMNSPGMVKATLDSVPADMRSYLELRDTGFNSIAYSSASSPGDKVKLEKDVQGPGWFYVRVNDADGKAHSEPYTLIVSLS